MKTLMTLICCVLLTNGFGQVWIDSHAKWTFDYFNVAETGTWRWEYTHDTIIQSHLSQVINATKYRYGGSGTSSINYGNTYTYHSNDSVFYLKDNKFFLLYDFGANIGDTWIIAIDTIFNACQDTAIVQVVDTGNLIINGNFYRTIRLETISESIYALNGLCVEKFGIVPTTYENSNFGFLPGYQYCEEGPIIDYDLLTFRCYEDSSFPTFNPTNMDCDTLTSTSELVIEKFNVYPNPAKSKLYIKSPKNSVSNVEIIDMNGRLIVSQQCKNNVDISKLKNGIYIVRIITDDKIEALTMKRFIKQ
ncbi:MAG: T9SS type A sorting domain-containing protein [Bacteroidales bacterium]|nr:T9SS type A sorting domain-containing protein [Bacteroidales bacterium]